MQHPGILLITDDKALAATLGGKLKSWGAELFHSTSLSSEVPGSSIEVALIDIRSDAAEMLLLFSRIRPELPFAEAVLVNRSGNVGAAMEGMRAGAGDELIAPFETETLRRKIAAACARSRKRQRKAGRRSLFAVFEQTMNAAVFAQAGEFETAREMLKDNTGQRDKKPG